MGEGNATPGPRPKVARLIDSYDLEGVGDELETGWTRSEDRRSLRALADAFNERLLRAALAEADVETVTADVSHLYALLGGETGSRGERTQVERRLEREGVDVETLTEEFVSHGAIRTYLTRYRGVSPPSRSDRLDRDDAAQTVEGLRQRTASVTGTKLARLRETGELSVGTHRVFVDVQVFCEECGKQYEAGTLLESGACDCFDESD